MRKGITPQGWRVCRLRWTNHSNSLHHMCEWKVWLRRKCRRHLHRLSSRILFYECGGRRVHKLPRRQRRFKKVHRSSRASIVCKDCPSSDMLNQEKVNDKCSSSAGRSCNYKNIGCATSMKSSAESVQVMLSGVVLVAAAIFCTAYW